jgi:hypothetical protein
MTAGVQAGAKSFMLLEWNTLNPIFRLVGGRSHRKIDCWSSGQRIAGASKGRSVIERIGDNTPPRKRADFQQVVTDKKASRTFA